MLPTLLAGDVVTIAAQGNYAVGDILVFLYGDDELLIHRCIEADWDNQVYICKGDNAFRLEKVDHEAILGKVITVSRNDLPVPLPEGEKLKRMCFLSKKVGRLWEDQYKWDNEALSRSFYCRLYRSIYPPASVSTNRKEE